MAVDTARLRELLKVRNAEEPADEEALHYHKMALIGSALDELDAARKVCEKASQWEKNKSKSDESYAKHGCTGYECEGCDDLTETLASESELEDEVRAWRKARGE